MIFVSLTATESKKWKPGRNDFLYLESVWKKKWLRIFLRLGDLLKNSHFVFYVSPRLSRMIIYVCMLRLGELGLCELDILKCISSRLSFFFSTIVSLCAFLIVYFIVPITFLYSWSCVCAIPIISILFYCKRLDCLSLRRIIRAKTHYDIGCASFFRLVKVFIPEQYNLDC